MVRYCVGQSVLQMPIQARIKPALSDQLLMITILGDAPTVEHQHSIGLFHR